MNTFRKIWLNLDFKEKLIAISSLSAPSLQRLSMLAAFGLCIRLIVSTTSGALDTKQLLYRIALIGLIFACATLMQTTALYLDGLLRKKSSEFVRRKLLENYKVISKQPDKSEHFKTIVAVEDNFVKAITIGFAALQQSVASMLFCFLICLLITYFLPILGISIIVAILLLTITLSKRQKTPVRSHQESLRKSKVKNRKLVTGIIVNGQNDLKVDKQYIRNAVDCQFESQRVASRGRNSKLAILMNSAAAISLIVILVLASGGTFSAWDPLFLIIVLFSIRLCVIQGKHGVNFFIDFLRHRDLFKVLVSVIDHEIDWTQFDRSIIGIQNPDIDQAEPAI